MLDNINIELYYQIDELYFADVVTLTLTLRFTLGCEIYKGVPPDTRDVAIRRT